MILSDTLQGAATASEKRAAVTSKATDGIRRHDLDTHTPGYGGRRCASSARRQEGGTEDDLGAVECDASFAVAAQASQGNARDAWQKHRHAQGRGGGSPSLACCSTGRGGENNCGEAGVLTSSPGSPATSLGASQSFTSATCVACSAGCGCTAGRFERWMAEVSVISIISSSSNRRPPFGSRGDHDLLGQETAGCDVGRMVSPAAPMVSRRISWVGVTKRATLDPGWSAVCCRRH